MKKDWDLTHEAFERLLAWLDADPDRAGLKYEEIRRALIKMFVIRECADVEDLADETINRVIIKLPEIEDSYVGAKELYFYGVARLISKEHKRKRQTTGLMFLEPEKVSEEYFNCLDKALYKLLQAEREIVLQYYLENKQAKIDSRKVLAESLGMSMSTLRVRVGRIRDKLKKYLLECLKNEYHADSGYIHSGKRI